jgi:hypothetical protein
MCARRSVLRTHNLPAHPLLLFLDLCQAIAEPALPFAVPPNPSKLLGIRMF